MFVKMNHEHLRGLLKPQRGPCVSLYISKRSSAKEYSEFYLKLLEKVANVLSSGTEALVNTALLTELLRFDPAEVMSEEYEGVAVFASRNLCAFYLCQGPVVDKFMVGQGFFVKPILDELQGEHLYNLLIVQPEELRLFSCQGKSWYETNGFALEKVNGNYFVHWKRFNENYYYEIPLARAPLKSFLRDIDTKLQAEADFFHRPLIVFGSREVFQLFKRTSQHPAPLYIEAQGDLRQEFQSHLLPEARQRMQEFLQTERQQSTQEYVKESAKSQASDRLEEISVAASHGKVKTLFLQKNMDLPGTYDSASGRVIYFDGTTQERMDDVLDDIARDVILRGGEVVLLEKSEMPTTHPIAAIFTDIAKL